MKQGGEKEQEVKPSKEQEVPPSKEQEATPSKEQEVLPSKPDPDMRRPAGGAQVFGASQAPGHRGARLQAAGHGRLYSGY